MFRAQSLLGELRASLPVASVPPAASSLLGLASTVIPARPPSLPGFSCPSDQFNLLPVIIGLVALGLLALVLVTFCVVRRRPPSYQAL